MSDVSKVGILSLTNYKKTFYTKGIHLVQDKESQNYEIRTLKIIFETNN